MDDKPLKYVLKYVIEGQKELETDIEISPSIMDYKHHLLRGLWSMRPDFIYIDDFTSIETNWIGATIYQNFLIQKPKKQIIFEGTSYSQLEAWAKESDLPFETNFVVPTP